MRAIDLFAGAGGWDVAARRLGIHADGVEIMAAALETRVAAGLHTVGHDVWNYDLNVGYEYDGLIASPPCQTFSLAGKGKGREDQAVPPGRQRGAASARRSSPIDGRRLTMYGRLLNLYAQLMCRAIWAARRFLPADDNGLPDIAVAKRDWEWHGWHVCENCGRHARHRFVEWIEVGGPVTTAECTHCGFEASL